MFACIYGQITPENDLDGNCGLLVKGTSFVNLAFSFSPLVEQTTPDTVVLDIEGEELIRLGNLSLKLLDCSLAMIEKDRAQAIRDTYTPCVLRMARHVVTAHL